MKKRGSAPGNRAGWPVRPSILHWRRYAELLSVFGMRSRPYA